MDIFRVLWINGFKDAKMIIVKNLWKSYGSLTVLKGLDLTVNDGETVVILGRSGVGKSVLLRQILGIELPDEGDVQVNGMDISKMNEAERYEAIKQMGMLFQGAALFDSMTVGENVAFYLRQHNKELSEKEIQERVAHALDVVNLTDMQDKMPSDLSGGMRKRAAIARVIIYSPNVILYDEPTTGLDPITAQHINELINHTQEKLKATSIVVTHDIRSALQVGDRLAFHHEGKIYIIASKKEFLESNDPILQEFFADAILSEKYLQSILN
jgi:phospholipid/cholesterol/gamma-HCH transport system ATP-binding protein